MFFNFTGKRIAALSTVVPKNERRFEDDAQNYNFPIKKSMKLKELMGYGTHRIALSNQFASDFAIAALEKIFANTNIKKEDIDALVYVTQSPDYFIPQTSTIIQHKIGLKEDIFCVDMNQGCAGFLHGLFESFMLLQNPSVKKVALLCADTMSKKVNPRDRNSHPLIGDGGAAAIIENSSESGEIFCCNKTFGDGAFAISIPAGGFRLPSSAETAKEIVDPDGNFRSLDNLVMEGASVFSFVQEKIPPIIESLLERSGESKESIDWFIFHQPNKFMLEKLADKIGIPYVKMPNNIVGIYGNGSSTTIPTCLTHNLSKILTEKNNKIFLAGFGVGLTAAGMVINLPKLDYCSLSEL